MSRNRMDKSALFNQIATEMYDAERVSSQVVAHQSALPGMGVDKEDGFVPPRTPTESKLAEIWARFLARERLGVHDDFFELGGDSLLAVRILLCAREVFQVELPMETLFADTLTVATMAKAIEQVQIAAADPEMVAALLDQLNDLSDEQVRAILAAQSGPGEGS